MMMKKKKENNLELMAKDYCYFMYWIMKTIHFHRTQCFELYIFFYKCQSCLTIKFSFSQALNVWFEFKIVFFTIYCFFFNECCGKRNVS